MKFSSTKTYSIITICAVVISLIFISTTLRFYNEAVENTEKLKQQKDSTEKINIKLEFNRNLSKADEQLILNENYAEALKAYFTLLNKYAADKEYTSMINARIEQVEILLQRPEINKAVKEYEIIISQNKKQIESLLADLSSKSTHSNTIDSLQKVNEKLVVELNKKTQEAKKKQLIQVITFKNE
jgi:lipopolysaccharide biosynthesis regulator YciM